MDGMHQGLQIYMVHDKILPFSKMQEMKSFESARIFRPCAVEK
jgi:hypothetical protein